MPIEHLEVDFNEAPMGVIAKVIAKQAELIDDNKKLWEAVKEIKKEAYEEGHKDGLMEDSVRRYEQAKEDGTLDKHFPRLV